MCNKACIDFGKANLREEDIRGRSVLEVGAMDFNGSLRPLIESFGPGKYIGVDIHMGPGVDQVCGIEELNARFGADSFDMVVCTEVMEHVEDWREAIHNLKQIVKPGGALLITTRSRGFGFHGFPFDFWRYELPDMERIFSDFEIKNLRSDPDDPGVLFLGRKPLNFSENDLKGYNLYSILFARRFPLIKNKIFRGMVFLLLLFKMFSKRLWGSAPAQRLREYLKKVLNPKLAHASKMFLLGLAGKTTITEVDLEFVNFCNLKCKWCSLDHGQEKIAMGEDLLRRFLDNLLADKRFGSIEKLNIFNGGEALLHPKFVRMMAVIKEYKEEFFKRDRRFPQIDLLTNATALSEKLSGELVELGVVDRIRFSVDGGSREKYEELRPGAKWDIVSGNIKSFVKINSHRIKTGIICIIEFDKPADREWMSAEFKALCDLVDQVELRYPHDWMGDVKVEGLKKVFKNYCRFLFQSLCLLPNGDVVVCCGDLNGKKGVVGNLYRESLYRIYDSRKRRKIRYALLDGKRNETGLCDNCCGY